MKRQHYAAGERLQLHTSTSSDTSGLSGTNKPLSSSTRYSSTLATSLYNTDNLRSLCLFAFVVGIKLVELYAQQQRRQAQETAITADSGSVNNILDDFLLDDDGTYTGDNNNSTTAHKPTPPSLHQLLVKSKGVIAPPRPPPSHTLTGPSLGASSGQSSGVVLVDPLEDKRLCPLCGKERVSPCVSTGGYVFCYLCLLGHLTSRPWQSPTADASATAAGAASVSNSGDELLSYCPVSGVPCRVSEMIRLYKEG